MASIQETGRKLWQTLSSIKTGVVLLIAVVIVSAAGTVILQRPITDPDDLQRAYSPQMLRILDALGLTDTFHAWWFVLLLALVSLSIVAASIQRFPNAWRYFSRPYKSTDENFRRSLLTRVEIPIAREEDGLSAAERALRKMHFAPERIVGKDRFSLFAERNRLSEMAVYIVHASLLLIFIGGIVDALYGWHGYLALTRGQQSNQVEVRNQTHPGIMPFAIRCDGAGQENYTDGSPKKWWSKLAVLEDGREVLRKEIVVNDPLVYRGIRFYQSSFGPTGEVDQLMLTATPTSGAKAQDIALSLNQDVQLDPGTTVRMVEFVPDYFVRDGQVFTRSKSMQNPAAHLLVKSATSGKSWQVWLPEIPEISENADAPYKFEARDLVPAFFTGLQVSHEPGQWAVWGGVLLMGLGLTFVFYLVHVRIWAVPLTNAKGQLVLWVGGASNKNKDAFEMRFQRLVEEIRKELKPVSNSKTPAQDTSMARV